MSLLEENPRGERGAEVVKALAQAHIAALLVEALVDGLPDLVIGQAEVLSGVEGRL